MKEQNDFYYSLNNHQRLFLIYTLSILIDLAVLNLFDEYWSLVHIESFSISLLAAMLLQLLLRVTIQLEHKVAEHFKQQEGAKAKIYRGLCTYLILVLSKFVILGAVNFTFGDRVMFMGPLHGVVAFVVVVFGILIAEAVVRKLYLALDNGSESTADETE